MKKRYLFLLAMILLFITAAPLFLQAANYYVDAILGDDSRSAIQAQNQATPLDLDCTYSSAWHEAYMRKIAVAK